MPTELEELVAFLHHGNTQIRQISAENLVSYSQSQPEIFKAQQLAPIADLKLLVKDYPSIAKSALTILINVSSDLEVLKALAEDDTFLETLLLRVTNAQEPNADLLAMLLANLAKSPSLERLISLKRTTVPSLSPSPRVIAQLLELFNLGPTRKYNKDATYDYLAYLFADLAKYPTFQTYLTLPTSPPSTALAPLTTFHPLTTYPNPPRRLGTATLLRNLTLAYPSPMALLSSPLTLFSPLLLPLTSSASQQNLTPEEMDLLPEECQYLSADEDTDREEKDVVILGLLLETIYLLVAKGGEEVREVMRGKGVYVIMRELHLRSGDEGVRGWCERVVDVLMVGGKEMGGREAEDAVTKRAGGESGAGKNIGGSGLPQAVNSGGGSSVSGINYTGAKKEEAREAAGGRMKRGNMPEMRLDSDKEDDDEDDAIVPIF